jgi:hypothetical protein
MIGAAKRPEAASNATSHYHEIGILFHNQKKRSATKSDAKPYAVKTKQICYILHS